MEEITITPIVCKFCGSKAVVKFGHYKKAQRYWCKSCQRKFADNKALPGRQVPPEQVGAAIADYYGGLSYGDIAKSMGLRYGREPSKGTIYRWVNRYTKLATKEMDSQKVNVDKVVADEIVIITDKGEKLWVFDIMDYKTRYFIVSYASERRNTHAVEMAFKQLRERTIKPPKVILTDQMGAYLDGIENVYGSETTHIRSGGMRTETNNNRVERLYGSIRERTKVLRCLRDRKTTQDFLDGWRVDYNMKPHEALKGKTPSEALGAQMPFKDWVEVAQRDTGEKLADKSVIPELDEQTFIRESSNEPILYTKPFKIGGLGKRIF